MGSVTGASGGGVRLDRLRERADFLALRSGRSGRGGLVSVQVSSEPRGKGDAVRVGFTVTRKVGNAVERNRIRRRLRAALRETAGDLPPALAGRDMAIIARRSALDASFDALKREIHRTVAKALQPRTKPRSRTARDPASP